nr:hypothetical protein [uncultured Mediterranean phage uvMED]
MSSFLSETESEFSRRDRLMDKCLDLAHLAFEQKDLETGGLMLRKAFQLLGTQLNAMELMQPGFIESLKNGPEWIRFARILRDPSSD